MSAVIPGAFQPADAKVQGIADQVKGNYLEKSKVHVEKFEAKLYRSQEAATGKVYVIQVDIKRRWHTRLKVLVPPSHTHQGPQLLDFSPPFNETEVQP